MSKTNREIADALDELADLYELDGAVVHRTLAYRRAARVVRESSQSVGEMALAGKVTDLPGIGKTLEEKIIALEETGEIPAAAALYERIPRGLVTVTKLQGIGPKRAKRLYEELGIDSVEKLKIACEEGALLEVKGFGKKFEQNALKAIADFEVRGASPRVLLDRAFEAADPVLDSLRKISGVERAELAGSARRWCDTVKDLDIVVSARKPEEVTERFVKSEFLETVRTSEAGAHGTTHSNLGIDLRVVSPEQFGNLLQHFSGSQAHNEQLRAEAVRSGLHVSEYGIKDDATGEVLTCTSEEEVYERLGYSYIPPELREGRGELEAAREDGLPQLVELEAIRGDLHCHTTASDGHNSIVEMATAARGHGYEYLAITDHSATHGFGDHVTPDELRRQIERVAEANQELKGITVLSGTETNILPDGNPDYEDDLLEQLDWVVASVHSAMSMDRKTMTDRICHAVAHPHIDAIGHPTGRLIDRREPYELDMERLFATAAKEGTFLEINANPRRRDLSDHHARAAAKAGVTLVINSDAHRIGTLDVMKYGVATARRGWLTAEQIANTRSLKELLKLKK